MPAMTAGATSNAHVTSSGTGMPAIFDKARAVAGAVRPVQAAEPTEQPEGLPLWTMLFFFLLGFMCLSQYIPKHGEYSFSLGNAKANGVTFTLISVENDPEN
jgi:hypothetical protein